GTRAALVGAAREVFAERGLQAPLYDVARRAGVGQGSLYRHFPDRAALVLAVFEENVSQLEEVAARPGTSLDDLLAVVTELAEHSSAFMDAVASGDVDGRLVDLDRRMRELLERPVAEARDAGALAADVTADDVMLALLMLSGALGRVPAEDRPGTSRRIWALVRRAWAPGARPSASPSGEPEDGPPGRPVG
ncbi:MAG TPA: TetR/AcrR family transcriptional regulator, partial [Actinotalea sp.]|nr:TetR/AcrR family transcriptional regulator [Actinotalea sp.]